MIDGMTCNQYDVEACVVCMVDDFYRSLDELSDRRAKLKAERGPELDANWRDIGGEG